jgi:SpoIID/LytB domain protein
LLVRRAVVALFLSALVPALVVAVPTVSASAATPHPVAPTIHTLALSGVDTSALAQQRRVPAAVADSDAVWTRETAKPAVLTGELKTAGYSAVGVTWQRPPAGGPPADLRVAVRTYDGSWQPWTTLEADADLPTGGDPKVGGEQGNGRAGTDPYFAGPSTGIQVRVDVVSGLLPAGLRVELVDPGTSPADSNLHPTALSTASAAAGLPTIVTRAQWGADEALRNGPPTYDSGVKMAFIHHTASQNTYTKAQAPAAVRSIYAYDTKGLGWSDIAYNVIVDKFGDVFEGRAGGLENAVRSAATGGFNPQTFSVSALGTYTSVQPTAAMLTSIERVLAWKLGLYHLDPFGTATLVASSAAGTTSRYPNGQAHTFQVISGHRDAGLTACPGTDLYSKLPAIRAAVKQLIGAAILAPKTSTYAVDKGSTSPITLSAKAMNAQQWQLLVADSTGHTVRTLTGSAAAAGAITVSWDGKAANGQRVAAGVYTLTLSSWTAAAASVPYIVNVAIDADPSLYSRATNGGSLRLEGLGYGHGHGMSQFGAAGAAVKGLTAAQILAFYYPGTTLTTVPTTTRVRVDLLGRVNVVAGAPDARVKASTGLYVSDGKRVLHLPAKIGTATIIAWRARLNSYGHLDLYGMHGASSSALKGWTGLKTSLRFTSTPGAAFTVPPAAPTTSRVSVYDASGAVRTYRGTIEVAPDATSLDVISDVRLDDYVKAVVSSEMPGGWLDAAYQAQAIAARSYALYKVQHESSTARWDLVDSTADQAYLGFSGETSPEAAAGTATGGQYLAYQGKAAFTQYSSSDGGWTAAGSQPYLPAKADPYDGVLKGAANWGHSWTVAVPATTIEHAWPSLGTLQSVDAAGRDGHGSWGGRTTSVVLVGSKGSVTVGGTTFRTVLGLRSVWWRVNPTPAQPSWPPPVPTSPTSVQTIPSVPQGVRGAGHDRAIGISWQVPLDNGNATVTGYHVTVSPGARSYDVAATARSLVIPQLINGKPYSITVSAKNVKGLSLPSTLTVTPTSLWSTYVPLPAASLRSVTLHPGVRSLVNVLGAGGVPTSLVGSVTLRVTASNAAAPTSLTVVAAGSTTASPTLTISHGSTVTTTVVVPVGVGGAVSLLSPHTVSVDVTVVGFSTTAGAAGGQRLVTVAPFRAGGGTATAGAPVKLLVAGRGGVPTGALGAFIDVTATAPAPTQIRLAPAAGAESVSRLVLPAKLTRSATVYAPIAADGTVTVFAGKTASMSVVVAGYLVADDGHQSLGRFEALPTATRVYDTKTALISGAVRHLALLGHGGLPSAGVRALLLQVNVTTPSRVGWLALAGHGDPMVRSMSYVPGTTSRTTLVVRPGSKQWVDLALHGGRGQVTVDVLGWWSG